MWATIEKVIKRYGTTFTVLRGDETREIKGIMQIVGAASRQNMRTEFTPLGEVPRGRYLLLAPLESEIEKGDVLVKGDEKRYYTVCRVEKIWYKEKGLYFWCLCEERGEPGQWGSLS